MLVVAGLLAAVYPQLGLAPGAERTAATIVRAMAILSIVLSVYRVVDVLADAMAAKAEQTDSKLDDQLVPLVRKALKVFVVLSGFLFLLQNLDVNVGSLIAGLGIGGVAVALAAKDTIANFFGSLMIFVDRPFQIGDWVRINGTEGIVEEVGFRSTRVRTFYNSLVTVPNAHFTEAAIDNMGLREYRRLSTVLNLTYDTTPEQMQAFVEGIRAIIVANPLTRKDYYEVHFSGFGAHSLDVMVYLFFKVDSWTEELAQKHNVLMEILRLAKELGVEFAFPTQTLHVEALMEQGKIGQSPDAQEAEKLTQLVHAFGPGGRLSRPASPLLTTGYVASTIKKSGEDG
jgi:MscS family membrane protein